MYIDCKETIWERFYVPEEYENEVTNKLNNGEDPYEVLNSFINDSESELLYETTEYMDVEDNNNEATVEAFDNNHLLFYKNNL